MSEISKVGRFPIVDVSPVVDFGRFPTKATQGEVLDFSATAFREGHDALAVELVLTQPDGSVSRTSMNLTNPGLDRWKVRIQLNQIGRHKFQISAWDDEFASWLQATKVKLAAGVDQELMMLEGTGLIERYANVTP